MKKNKSRPIIFVTIGLLVLFVFNFSVLFFVNKGFKMEFYQSGGDAYSDIYSVEKIYDKDALKKQLGSGYGYVYYSPTEKDFYSIAEKFGLSENSYEQNSSYERNYNELKATLNVDKYGRYVYKTGVEETDFELPYSMEEMVNIARNYIDEMNLLDNHILSEDYSSNGIYLGWDNIPIQKTIKFYPLSEDGHQISNEFIAVTINGNGEVVEVRNNILDFDKSQKTDLISISKAFSQMEKGNASCILADEPIDRFKFDNVEIMYEERDNADGDPVLQPIFLFSGGYHIKPIEGGVDSEKYWECKIAVQANNYNSFETLKMNILK